MSLEFGLEYAPSNDFQSWCHHYSTHLNNMYDILQAATNLTDTQVPFGVFCSYVYLNSRPLRHPGFTKYARPLTRYV